MIVHREYPQGSQAWLEARAGIATASEFHRILTPKFEIRKGEMFSTYVAQKLAEKWSGPLPGFSSWATEQGSILEDTAIPWFEFAYDCEVDRVGLVTTDDGLVGCSPDGLLGEDSGLEIKCPEATAHTKYLLAGTVPDDYLCQIHGSMFVTERPQWTFCSFRRGFPALVLTVERDDAIQDKIAEALALFLARMDSGWKCLLELNGGEPPPKREPMVFSVDMERDNCEVIP